MEVLQMRIKKTKEVVDIYYIDCNGIATYFSRGDYANNKGGWQKLSITKFLPVDVPIDGVISKTERNKIKSRLTLVDAIWQTSDGSQYDHAHLEDAIEHEKSLIEKKEVSVM